MGERKQGGEGQLGGGGGVEIRIEMNDFLTGGPGMQLTSRPQPVLGFWATSGARDSLLLPPALKEADLFYDPFPCKLSILSSLEG